jgi:hypothetical protein
VAGTKICLSRSGSAIGAIDRLGADVAFLMHGGRLAAGAAALDSRAARIAKRLADDSADSRWNWIAVRDRGFLGQSAACRKGNSGAQKGYRAHLKVSPLMQTNASYRFQFRRAYCPVIFFCCSIATAL